MSGFRRRKEGGEDSSDIMGEESFHGGEVPRTSARKDAKNIGLLVFLYVLQGIPLGLSMVIPFILSQKNVGYKEQAEFSFAYWPFSIKLLWAPIVDSLYFPRFGGRRKTWLVPVQYGIAIVMYFLSSRVESFLDDENINALTVSFFLLNFLAATQDIAVDGWALTMLRPENVSYASTCNSVGQTAGYFLGYVGYLGMKSYGLVTLEEFLLICAYVFGIATTLVAIFVREKEENVAEAKDSYTGEENALDEHNLGVIKTYQLLYKILRLDIVMPILVVFLLTEKIGFSATDSVTSLKLIEAGVPKESLAMLVLPLMPLQIILPLFVSRYTSGSRPLDISLKFFPYRLLFGPILAAFVWITPKFALQPGSYPYSYYALLILIFGLHQITINVSFVAKMAFISRVSDPVVGGTYMTLLNTLSNLGGNWPSTLSLWLVDNLSSKRCLIPESHPSNVTIDVWNDCFGKDHKCAKYGGTCKTEVEGYYIEIAICVIFGFLWLKLWGSKAVQKLQDTEISEYRIFPRKFRRS